MEEAKSSGSIGRVYGAIGGSEGILKESFLDLMQYPEEKLSLLLQTPATAIGSSRYALNRRTTMPWRESSGNMEYGMCSSTGETEPWIPAAASLRRAGRGHLCGGIPKTIDNDIAITDHTPDMEARPGSLPRPPQRWERMSKPCPSMCASWRPWDATQDGLQLRLPWPGRSRGCAPSDLSAGASLSRRNSWRM